MEAGEKGGGREKRRGQGEVRGEDKDGLGFRV